MALTVSHISVDARDAYAQSVWWAEVLDMHEDPDDPNEPGHEECLIISADGRNRILFIEVPEPKQIKNRLHFDLRPNGTDREQELARVIALGATQLADRRRSDGSGWVTLADPEGNEFCVLRTLRQG
jgi:hypothetical protein